jgi:hypothetical protein
MRPLQTKETNSLLVHPECFDLPVAMGKETLGDQEVTSFTTTWELSTEEIMMIMNSGKIEVTILSNAGFPPVRVRVIDDHTD